MASTDLYVAFGKWLLDSGMTVPGIHDSTPAEAWIYFSGFLSMKDFFEGMLFYRIKDNAMSNPPGEWFPEFRWDIPDVHVGCVIFSTTDTGDEFINGRPATIAVIPCDLWSKYSRTSGFRKFISGALAERWSWEDDLETVLPEIC